MKSSAKRMLFPVVMIVSLFAFTFAVVTVPQPASAAAEGVTAPQPESAAPEGKSLININSASAEELQELPGIGPVIAAKIVEYRTANGPFQSLDDLKNVQGIGDKKFDAIKAMITIE
ncbi:MAG: ComEA family DNA-binding protein [Thermodesulfobacteriota bacterium]|nr:ComEA family DNA-binding protein [Thermodesulfobacteriota bacterium]